MIYSNEVREGNIVKSENSTCLNDAGIVVLDAKNIYNIAFLLNGKDDILHPIPVTFEWFERLGFLADGMGRNVLYYQKTEFWISYKRDNVIVLRWVRSESHSMLMQQEFRGLSVHQLQNIIHSLTGLDLKMKKLQ